MKKAILCSLLVISLSAIMLKASDSETERFLLGRSLFENSSLSLSNVIFRSISSDFPESDITPDASFMAAEALYKKGDYRAAISSYTEADEDYPQAKNRFRKEIYYRMALCSLKLEDYEKGAYYSAYVADKYSDTYIAPDACLLAAENYFNNNDMNSALAYLGRLEKYKDYKNFDYAYYLTARIYYERFLSDREKNAKDSDEAMRYFNRVETEYKSSAAYPRAMFWKANLLYSTGNYKEAIRLADISASLETDTRFKATAMYFKAWCLYMMSDFTRALSIFDETAAMYPDYATAPWSKYKAGLCLEALSRGKEAESRYKKVIEDNPGTIPQEYASYALGDSLYKRNEYYDANDIFARLMGSGITELAMPAHYMTAECLMKINKYRLAAEVYAALAAKYPAERGNANYMRAWCLYKDADFKGSEEIYNSIVNDSTEKSSLRGKAMVKLGDNLYAQEKFDDADEVYKKAASDFGSQDNVVFEALYGSGWVRYGRNDFAGASSMFGRAKKRAPDVESQSRADMMDANCRYSMLKFEEAQAIYDKVSGSKQTPDDMKNEARFYSAWCDYRLGKFDEAAAKWERYGNDSADPVKKAEAVYRRGWAYFRKNDFDSAAKSFDEVIEKYPKTHFMQEALLKKGDCFYNKGEYEKAIDAYRVLVDKYPSHYRVPEALYGIQWSYYSLGKDEEAVKMSRDFLEKYGSSPFASEIQYRVAEHYFNAGNHKAAIEEFKGYIEKNKDAALLDNALYFLAMSHMALNENAEAVPPLKKILSDFPKSNLTDRTLFKLATCYFKLNDFEHASKSFSDYAMANPDSEYADDACFNAGMAFKRLSDTASSERMYKLLIEKYPQSPLAERGRMNLGYLYQDGGKYEEAINAFRSVTELNGKKAAEALFWTADVYQAQGNTEAAHAAYLDVYIKYKADEMWAVSALDTSGRLYEKNGELKKAIDMYRKIEKGGYSKKYTETAAKKADLLNEQYKLLNPTAEETKGPVKKGPVKEGVK